MRALVVSDTHFGAWPGTTILVADIARPEPELLELLPDRNPLRHRSPARSRTVSALVPHRPRLLDRDVARRPASPAAAVHPVARVLLERRRAG